MTWTIARRSAALLGAGALAFCLLSCAGTDATQTAEECASSDLIAQCPPGSDPVLGAEATSECGGQASGSLVERSGSFSGQCQGTGNCQVLCQFAVPCECGVESVTDAGVICTQCTDQAACGNNICEGGEDPESCPRDCGATCTVDDERCNGNDRQVCNQQGQWDTLACPDGTISAEAEDDTTSCQ